VAIDIKIPALGESISEGVISRWLKKEGERVNEGDIVLELETDKVNAEIPAPASGVLHPQAQQGDMVAVGSVVGTIAEGEGASSEKEEKQAPAESAAEKPQKEKAASAEEKEAEMPRFRKAKSKEREGKTASPESAPEPVVSPLARRVAEGEGADLSRIQGSGPAGKIMKRDVLEAASASRRSPDDKAAASSAPSEPAPAASDKAAPEKKAPSDQPAPRERREKMSPLRRRIAERLVQSQQTTATLTTFNEADMTEIMAARQRYKDLFKEKGGSLGFMSFFVKAAVDALRAFPAVNARIDGDEIVYNERYDFGVAVSTERGLVVPVIRDVDRLSFSAIEAAIADAAKRARDNKLQLDELQGGTFTITNGGVFGSLLSTPIINPPQAGILGMHAIQDRPVARDGQVVIRPMMYIALSYDHRIIDGRESVSFLKRVKDCVERPERMLLGI
jgi:2-oxoglutarate dehydrogenase E2 component (dihydrolipoamide succinyltransferase)